MVLVDGSGLPLAVDVDSASPAEVNLIEPLIDESVTPYVPERLIYDRAADSDPLRQRLASRGIELICPHRRRRVKPPTQDGRPLRRFRRRWIIERTIAWLNRCRRLAKDWERLNCNALAFLRWASIRRNCSPCLGERLLG